MITYNDVFQNYIDILIHDEQKRPEDKRNQKIIDKLKEDKKIYEKKKEMLDRFFKNQKISR